MSPVQTSPDFHYDVFVSHCAKDKQAVPVPDRVRLLAEGFTGGRAEGMDGPGA